MIQCVEQRNDERPYCSRVCCTTAVKNALAPARNAIPQARIIVLYRDMRTYGFREAAYREAREKGRPVRPLRAGAAAAAARSTGGCSCGSGSRRWDATCN